MSNSGVLASIEEYVERLQQREEGCTEEGLRGFNWHKAELAGCDLSGLNLRELDMRGADLSEANLSRANLRKAYLRKANLSKADLREANLVGADLSEADLCEAYLWWANLRGADLRNANLSAAYLSEANLVGADLRDANLSAANLRNANLSGADLRDADLSNADLSNADLTGADLSGAKLRDADLSEANLSDTILDWDAIPLVPNVDAVILSAIEAGGGLEMADWYITSGTTHTWARWAVVLAGDAGRELEKRFGTNAAASLIYAKSSPLGSRVPDWFADNETALADIRKRAQQQLMASQPTSPEAQGMESG